MTTSRSDARTHVVGVRVDDATYATLQAVALARNDPKVKMSTVAHELLMERIAQLNFIGEIDPRTIVCPAEGLPEPVAVIGDTDEGRRAAFNAPGRHRDYALVLEARKRRGEIREWHFEDVTFRLADDTRYTPDFFVVTAEWFAELHEVKGFMRDDARVKMKVCARTFSVPLYLVKRKGQGWDIKLVEPDEPSDTDRNSKNDSHGHGMEPGEMARIIEENS